VISITSAEAYRQVAGTDQEIKSGTPVTGHAAPFVAPSQARRKVGANGDGDTLIRRLTLALLRQSFVLTGQQTTSDDQATACTFRFLRQPSRTKSPMPVTNSGSAPGSESGFPSLMSAFGGKADIDLTLCNVCF
jgi:hypothetical protein